MGSTINFLFYKALFYTKLHLWVGPTCTTHRTALSVINCNVELDILSHLINHTLVSLVWPDNGFTDVLLDVKFNYFNESFTLFIFDSIVEHSFGRLNGKKCRN